MGGDDKYTYPNSGGVLRNRLNIVDGNVLDEVTNAFVSAGMADLEVDPAPAAFDFDHLKETHHRLFSPVFEWAGQVRDVELQAAGTSLTYAPSKLVEDRCGELFAALSADDWLAGLDALVFTRRAAVFWGQLTLAHPFRDGNTRTQSSFMKRLSDEAGHPLAWDQIQVDQLRTQRLAAAMGNYEALAFFLEDNLIERPISLW